MLLIDGNTGTQLDVPPHSVARPELKREKSGPLGLAYTDKIEPWQFGGEACVVDVRDLLDQAPKGVSPLVKPRTCRAIREAASQAARSATSCCFAATTPTNTTGRFPKGSRFIADVLDRKAPGYPDPDPDCMEFLATRGVMTLGTDSASMGPLPDLAEPTHYAGLKHGMIWTEGATNLGALPPTGAFYCMLGPEARRRPVRRRAGVLDRRRRLAEAADRRLPRASGRSISRRRSPPNLPVTSPGSGTGQHRQVYLKIDFLYSDYLDMWHHGHLMDAMAGTHLVPPSFALPPDEAPVEYAPEVRGWLEEYEKKYGKRGVSTSDHRESAASTGPAATRG